MTSIPHTPAECITVGVDTHKHAHAAVALTEIGGRLAETTIPADTAGYQQLQRWATGLGTKITFGVEGTGSYGAGLASYLRRHGHRVVEVTRPNRQDRHLKGKNDALDADAARYALRTLRAATGISATKSPFTTASSRH